jgi:hypothetical protein
MKALTLEQLIEKAPAIATQNASSDVSDKYSFIPSTKVIEDVIELGWTPVNATQRSSNSRCSDNSFAQHMVNFRIDNPISVSHSGDIIYPQITFVNSHDGKSTFRFYAGLFRLVCSNGLTVPFKLNGEELGKGFRIRHKGYDMDTLSKTFKDIVRDIKGSMKPIFDLNERMLTQEEKINFAKRGLSIREGIKRTELQKFLRSIPNETIDSILTPNRELDMGNNAWRVFNVVQESLIGGNYKGFSIDELGNVKTRGARPLSDMVKTQDINTRLFAEAQLLAN